MKTKKYFVIIDGYIEAETELAVLLCDVWIPKSVFHPSEDGNLQEGCSGDFLIERWFVLQEDIDYEERG